MTEQHPQHCGHECVCGTYKFASTRTPELEECLRRNCRDDTRTRQAQQQQQLPPTKEWTVGMVYAFEAGLEEGERQAQQPVNQSERLHPCPKCEGYTFCMNVDGGYTIACLDDMCKWKQQITAQQPDALDDVIRFLEFDHSCQLDKITVRRVLDYIRRKQGGGQG